MAHLSAGARVARPVLAAGFAVAAGLCALGACAGPADVGAAPPPREVDVRVLVKLAHPSVDATAIAAEATRQAGVPVRYATAVSAAWHALSLHCADAAACDAAIARLRGSANIYEAVEPDGRKQRAVM